MQPAIWLRRQWGAVRANGSISRTSMNEQYGGKTQGGSVVAAIVMAVILLTATGFIGYLPCRSLPPS